MSNEEKTLYELREGKAKLEIGNVLQIAAITKDIQDQELLEKEGPEWRISFELYVDDEVLRAHNKQDAIEAGEELLLQILDEGDYDFVVFAEMKNKK